MGAIKFIHAADLHLDSPFKGLKHLPLSIFERLTESTFSAFRNMVDRAITEQVDFILIAGDVFDDDIRSLKAQIAMRVEFERLKKHGIFVYIIHGNHDHLGGKWADLTWPDNVYFFSSKVDMVPFIKNNERIAHIYGFSYEMRAETRNRASEYEKIAGARFHIGMLHGNLEGNMGHDPYAPFTVEQLVAKNFDYWALGHIHKQQIICEAPLVIYPGNIQGRNRKESGAKGCYLVELSESSTTYQFVPTATIIWENEQVAIDHVATLDELIVAIERLKDRYRALHMGTILTVSFIGTSPLYSQLIEDGFTDELVEIVNENEADEERFVWISACHIELDQQYDRARLKQDSHFISDLLQQIDNFQDHDEEIEKALSGLYRNRRAMPFLQDLKEMKQEIIAGAERLIIHELLKK